MKIDLNKYSINRPFIQDFYRKSTIKDVSYTVSMCSTSTHCPIIVLAIFLGEDIGYTPEIVSIVERLIKFYGYTEILGQKEGSPFLGLGKK